MSYLILDSKGKSGDEHDLMFWVGILLIISAGSFIYVATIHILPEVLGGKNTHDHMGEKKEGNDEILKIE